MNEFDFRPECEQCDGIGAKPYQFPPSAESKILEYIKGGVIVECWKCKGEGRLPMFERVELVNPNG